MKKVPRVYNSIPKDVPVKKGDILRGLCDREDKTLYINPKQGDKQQLITAIHEALHYLFPKHKEGRVEDNGTLIGEVVWKLGYRSRPKRKK